MSKESLTFRGEFMGIIFTAASFVVALAWRDAIKSSFDHYIKSRMENEEWVDSYPNAPLFIYAAMITIIVVLAGLYFNRSVHKK